MRSFTSFAILVTVVAGPVSGCGERADTQSETEAAPYEDAVVAARMKDHFHRAVELREAVVAGQLDAIRSPATWLAEHAESAAMPEEWEQWLDPVREAAGRVVAAKGVTGAARATAELAAGCGQCHEALEAEVGFAIAAPPEKGAESFPHMHRHAWAADRMWEGLVTRMEEVWDGGAEVIRSAPLAPAEIPADLDVLAEVAEIERGIHSLGEEAVQARTWPQRAHLYGLLLGRCARCHDITGGGPR